MSPLVKFPHLQVGLHLPHAPEHFSHGVEMNCLRAGLAHKAPPHEGKDLARVMVVNLSLSPTPSTKRELDLFLLWLT